MDFGLVQALEVWVLSTKVAAIHNVNLKSADKHYGSKWSESPIKITNDNI